MPTLLPTLRMRLNNAVPSLRNRGDSVANVTAASGTKTNPVPTPWMKPGPDDRRTVHLQVESPSSASSDRAVERKAGSDDQACIEAAHQPADDEHCHERADAARRRDEPGR